MKTVLGQIPFMTGLRLSQCSSWQIKISHSPVSLTNNGAGLSQNWWQVHQNWQWAHFKHSEKFRNVVGAAVVGAAEGGR